MHAELSSLTSTASGMKLRISGLTAGLHPEKDAELLAVLYEVERSLGSVTRQLDRASRLTRRGK